MELELVEPTHIPKRCPKCGEITLRGRVRWKADSTCRACKYDFDKPEGDKTRSPEPGEEGEDSSKPRP